MKEIILASVSKRRSRILSECGISHRVVPSGAKEDMDKNKHISENVKINALRKAEAGALLEKHSIIIGADTLVAHGPDIIGKPKSENEARKLLEKFSGSRLEVYTGLCVICSASGKKAVGFEKSNISVVSLTQDRIEKYFRLLGPYDKAGGFSIEGVGSLIFDDINGSYFNILGLPMIKLSELFEIIGEDIADHIKHD